LILLTVFIMVVCLECWFASITRRRRRSNEYRSERGF